MLRRNRKEFTRRLFCEQLECRCVLSATTGSEFHAVMVAGDPTGSPADSPTARVDANTTTSPFAGVGSLQINANRGTYICTATPIDATHVLTAGHCVDLNDDGKSDRKDGIKSIYFILNDGGNQTSKLLVSKIDVQPDFTGFNRPSVNDDISILTLSTAVPAGVPVYPLVSTDMAAGTSLTLVGYGQSGDGVNGYTVSPSFTVKRVGQNNADAFYGQDDARRPAANEVWRFDFDGPSGSGMFGGATLGNNVETTLGGGDSGGPAFVQLGSTYYLAGNNTFTQGTNAPKFGTLGGGINLYPYLGWINSVLLGTTSTSFATGTGGPGNGGSPADINVMDALVIASETNDSMPSAEEPSGSTSVAAVPSNAQIAGNTLYVRAELSEIGSDWDHAANLIAAKGSLLDTLQDSTDGSESDSDSSTSSELLALDAVLRRWA